MNLINVNDEIFNLDLVFKVYWEKRGGREYLMFLDRESTVIGEMPDLPPTHAFWKWYLSQVRWSAVSVGENMVQVTDGQ